MRVLQWKEVDFGCGYKWIVYNKFPLLCNLLWCADLVRPTAKSSFSLQWFLCSCNCTIICVYFLLISLLNCSVSQGSDGNRAAPGAPGPPGPPGGQGPPGQYVSFATRVKNSIIHCTCVLFPTQMQFRALRKLILFWTESWVLIHVWL